MARPRADVTIQVRTPGGAVATVVASGHLDEVQELAQGGTKLVHAHSGGSGVDGGLSPSEQLLLVEAAILGEGAFSRVSEVTEGSTQRTFALKRMAKKAALQCPEHVYCEQHISKNTANAFCIRQYASFKVGGLPPANPAWALCGWFRTTMVAQPVLQACPLRTRSTFCLAPSPGYSSPVLPV